MQNVSHSLKSTVFSILFHLLFQSTLFYFVPHSFGWMHCYIYVRACGRVDLYYNHRHNIILDSMLYIILTIADLSIFLKQNTYFLIKILKNIDLLCGFFCRVFHCIFYWSVGVILSLNHAMYPPSIFHFQYV